MPAISFPIGSGERHRRWPAPLALPLAFGTEHYPSKVRRRLQTLNAMAYLIVATSTLYAAIYALEDVETYFWIVVVNLVLAAVGICVPFSHRFHELAGGGLIMVCEPLALFALVAVLGRDAGIQLNLIVGAAAPFVILGLERPAFVATVIVLCFALHVAALFLFRHGHALNVLSSAPRRSLDLTTAAVRLSRRI